MVRNGRYRYPLDSPASVHDAFSHLAADYEAMRSSRFRRRLTGVAALGSGADFHYKNERQHLHLMELARHFDRNDVIVGQGITRVVNNVLQKGITLDPQTGDLEADRLIADRWNRWSQDADRCHIAGVHNLHRLARMALRAEIVDGDIFFVLLKEGAVQPVEAERVRSPNRTKRNVVNGVLLDAFRRPLEYWFLKDAISTTSAVKVGDITPLAARDADGHRQVLHLFNPKRVSQTRGITCLAPIANMVGMHDDLQFAQLVKAQVSSCYAILEELDLGALPAGDAETGQTVSESLSDGGARTIEGLSPGMRYRGEPGVKLTGFSPNVPNPEFFEHARLMLTFIAVNLDLPLPVLLLDPSRTNFSGWRGAMDQARIGFREMQARMIERFYRPIFTWKLRQWLAEDPTLQALEQRLQSKDSSLFRHRWSPPTWPYIEPTKDATADAIVIKNRLNSRRGVLSGRGLDLDQVDEQVIVDNQRFILAAIEAAGQINTRFADARVDWRELAGFDPAGRKADSRPRAMENIARGVRSGVAVAVSEARIALGLPPQPPEGETLLRFNDQDVLQYHIENTILTVNEVRHRLGLAPVAGGNVFIQRLGSRRVRSDGTVESQTDATKGEETAA